MLDLSPAETIRYYALAVLGAIVTAAGLGAALYMEHAGHVVTGMDNQIVWGLPHVVAIFLIVAASGVLNVASIGSVFSQAAYKSRAPLSALLCIALLAGGLAVIMLDLGRADRLVVAATHFNWTSVFGWNVILYPGMFAIVAVYLWTLMETRIKAWSKPAGVAAFLWRLLLTTGTGSIFAFLVARPGYGSAILAPMFIIMSFAWGLAVFILVQAALWGWRRGTVDADLLRRMKNLLGVFVAAVLFFVAVHLLTTAYFERQLDFVRFLVAGSEFAPVFWIGQIFFGGIAPMVLIWWPAALSPARVTAAAGLVVFGALCQLWVFIIGGQAFPLDIFPGYSISSSFHDGAVAHYAPRLPEFLLAAGGVGIAFLATLIGVRVLPFLPREEFAAQS